MKKLLGHILFGISILILLLKNNSSITGGFIIEQSTFSIINLIGILMFIGAVILMFTSGKRLEYLFIPAGESKWKEERLEKALKAKKSGRVKKFYWMEGADSEEDILLVGKKVKKGDRIGIDTFPWHYREYKELIKKAQKQGKFPKEIKIENVAISQKPMDYVYGVIGFLEELFKRRELKYKENRNEKYLEKIKSLIHKFI